MIHVRITSPEWSPSDAAIKRVVRAEFKIDGRHVWIEGDAHYIDLSLPVLEPSGRQVLFHDDPEAWASNLPSAYRSGDVAAEVVDTHVPAVV